MKKNELTEVIDKLLKDVAAIKNLDADLVMEALKESLASAARKFLQLQKRVDVEINSETNEVEVFLRVEVVDDYPDYDLSMTAEEVAKMDEGYMLLDDAREFNEDAQPGDLLEMEIPVENFGRQAVQTAKQFLIQKVKEAERGKVFETYRNKVGMLITGTVTRSEKKSIFVSIGKNIEAVMLESGQIRKEKLKRGVAVKAVIEEVSDSAKGGAQVILSRTSGKFLAELFRQEVPEIGEGTVEIKGVARDPGFRAKIAVLSRDNRIDPVGACVGMRGNRVQAIVRELSNERIDIVNWSEDLSTYIRRALSPANIVKMIDVAGTRRTVIIVADIDLAQAIGRNGQNVRLASILVDRVLDVFGETEWTGKSDEEKQKELAPRPSDMAREARSQKGRLEGLFRNATPSFTDETDENEDLDGMEAVAQAGADAAVEEQDESIDPVIPTDRENSET
ncbi:MAG TPA: transcription termination factor NusA [Fibrobacteraceae bacterium]|nr:transcription termination factor NusA [Fibrobacteraceae bacterium]